jgi:ribosomal-protein-alanine N-acetyltransferase
MIRTATSADIPRMRQIEQQAYTAAHWGEREYDALFAPDAPKRVALVAAQDDQGWGEVADSARTIVDGWAADRSHGEAGGGAEEIVGFVIARCALDEWEVENVVVAGERRRAGIGLALVDELLRLAKEGGVKAVLLEVRESNTAARRLYEKIGFTEVGRRTSYYQGPVEDALLLKCTVSFP